jgi:hypothetical protein
MTIEQTIEIPASRHLSLDLPIEVPTGKAYMAIFIQPQTPSPISQGQSKDETFRNGLRRAYGAWQNRPWENAHEDIRTMRDEWGHRHLQRPTPSRL